MFTLILVSVLGLLFTATGIAMVRLCPDGKITMVTVSIIGVITTLLLLIAVIGFCFLGVELIRTGGIFGGILNYFLVVLMTCDALYGIWYLAKIFRAT